MTGPGKTKVLYIGGYSRSGSTLLLRLLGEQGGVVAVGELFDVWERSYTENQLCGCGAGFRECGFWAEVTAGAFGCTPGEVPASALNEARRRVQGRSRIPVLWQPKLRSRRFVRDLHEYADVLSKFYGALQETSGGQLIVDSSKVPQYAWILAEVPSVELHMVHLIRDSRATAFSWKRARVRPEITGRMVYMDRHSVVRSALEWDLFNYLIGSRKGGYASYTVVKYEDLIANPERELCRISEAVGYEVAGRVGGSPREVSLGISHTASGNPARFQVGDVGLTLDSEWMSAMRLADRLRVTALSAPGLLRYRYSLRRRTAGVYPRTEAVRSH